MSNARQQALIARAATIAYAVCGLICGYLLGTLLALQLAENSLDQYAKLIAIQENASSAEARGLLEALKKPAYPACSDAEISYFRELVFRSDYLKDVGRISGGNIQCSATSGRPIGAIGQFKQGSPQQDGSIVYSKLDPSLDKNLKRDVLQLGNAYVVFGSHMAANMAPFPAQLAITMTDAAGQPSNGTFRKGDTLFATRCSDLHFNCVTASAPVSAALRGERGTVAGSAMLGCLAGVVFGIVFSRWNRRSLTIEQQLRRAIAQDKVKVAYQPIVSMANDEIVGAEALARWTNEEGVAVNPEVFVKIAEEHGFIGSLTKLVVQRVLQDFGETLRRRPDFRINVNVTAGDLADPKFLPMLDDSLKRAKVTPKSLVIEITESSTANQEVAIESIRSLRRRGHSIYIDDFGTGYSSLSYLLYLSVDTIKIDKSFTRAIGTESVTVAILPQIMEMARSLNLGVVVEGIENDRQALYFSTSLHRLYGQGWLYGGPISAEAMHGQLMVKNPGNLIPAILTESLDTRLLPVQQTNVA